MRLVHLLDVVAPLVAPATYTNLARAMLAHYYCPLGRDGYQCSANGHCKVGTWVCECTPPYAGPSCEIRCPKNVRNNSTQCYLDEPPPEVHHSALFRSVQ